jgi:hypothetical protein
VTRLTFAAFAISSCATSYLFVKYESRGDQMIMAISDDQRRASSCIVHVYIRPGLD